MKLPYIQLLVILLVFFTFLSSCAPSDSPCHNLTITHLGPGTPLEVDLPHSEGCPTGTYLEGEIINFTSAPHDGAIIRAWIGTDWVVPRNPVRRLTMPAAPHTVGIEYETYENFCGRQTDLPVVECLALVAFYRSTDGPNWTRYPTEDMLWFLNDSICGKWLGIDCQGSHITRLIFLNFNHITGSLPAEMGNLKYLYDFRIQNNQISGQLPPEIGGMTNLRTLNLSNMDLVGPLPAEVGQLFNLVELDLYGNDLTGAVPVSLGNLRNLKLLNLSGNAFAGELPASIGNLANLENLGFYNTNLSGSVPHAFTALSNLQYLNIANTDICTPQDSEFQSWLSGVTTVTGTDTPCGCYPLALSHSGNGNLPILTSSTAFECPAGNFPEGEIIFLTAQPDNGWHTSGWEGTDDDSSFNETNTLHMPGQSSSVEVIYQEDSTCYSLSTSFSGSGNQPITSPTNSANCPPGSYTADEAIKLNADPAPGSHLSSWSGTDNDSSFALVNTLLMPPRSATVNVVYEEDTTCYQLTRIKHGSGDEIVLNPRFSQGCQPASYVVSEVVHLTASPAADWYLYSWEGSDDDSASSTSNHITIPPYPSTVEVTYANSACYPLTVKIIGSGTFPEIYPTKSIDCQNEGHYIEGEIINFIGVRGNPGWHLKDWDGADRFDSRGRDFRADNNQLTMPSSSHTVTIIYEMHQSLCQRQTEIPNIECLALAALYQYTDGQNWYRGVSEDPLWFIKDQICQDRSVSENPWLGIECASGHIKSIVLQERKLSGPLPSELGNLLYLTELDLRNNELTGEIPLDFGSLASLMSLDLGKNSLSGNIPASLGNLSLLTNLFLDQNRFSSQLPPELSRLVNLRTLNIQANASLTGPIPQSFSFIVLEYFNYTQTDLCLPQTPDLLNWRDSIQSVFGPTTPCNCFPLTSTHTGDGNDPEISPSASHSCPQFEFYSGEVINFTARPAAGWHLSGWTGSDHDSSLRSTTTLTMPGTPASVIANYANDSTCYQLNLSFSGPGSLPSAFPANSTGCPIGQYLINEHIALQAYPDSGSHLSKWQGTDHDTSILLSNTLTITGKPASVVVAYNENITCYPLTKNISGLGGEIVTQPDASPGCAPGFYHFGETVTLQAFPSGGWYLSSWDGTNDDQSTQINNSFVMPPGPHSIRVQYSSFSCYPLSVEVLGNGAFPVIYPTKSDGCAEEGYYQTGDSIYFSRVAADPGWFFRRWLGTDNDSTVINFEFRDNRDAFNSVTMPSRAHQVTVEYESFSDFCARQIDLPASECNALMAFYRNTDGPNWYRHPTYNSWFLNDYPCSSVLKWGGITCFDGHVIGLDLNFRLLNGTIPPEIGNLTYLENLNLSNNFPLSGTLPQEIGSLSRLKFINASATGLSGPIPLSFSNLGQISSFGTLNTDLCLLPDQSIQAWYAGITSTSSPGPDPCACYPLTLGHSGNGLDPVVSTSAFSCNPGEYMQGEIFSIQANPDVGYQVSAWMGTLDDSSTESFNSILMPSLNHSVSVTYEPALFDRCGLFEEKTYRLYMLDIQPNSTALTLYIHMSGGVPGLEINVPDPGLLGWEYSAILGSTWASNCSFQGYANRLYCNFNLPTSYMETVRPLKLYLNHCEEPIYNYAAVSIIPLDSDPGGGGAANVCVQPPHPDPQNACWIWDESACQWECVN